jgi:holliday junction DNA helicase RuvA
VIAHLEGVLRVKTATRIVVAVGGVGYEVLVSLSTFTALPDEGKTVSLRIHTHVREDAIQLFGFHTDLERALFEQLIRTNGVGPKLAQAVLSGMAPRDLVAALRSGDVMALRAVPGVGLKTAQRLLMEMRDRVGEWAGQEDGGPASPAIAPAGDDRIEAVTSALVNLGTTRTRAEDAARDAASRLAPDEPVEALVRSALRSLAR